MSQLQFQTGRELFKSWRHGVSTGKSPIFYPVGSGRFAEIEIGHGLLTVIGGAPGQGKTALTMQWVVDALTLTRSLKALVCNVEMGAIALFDRQFARLSGVDLSVIRRRRCNEEEIVSLEAELNSLGEVAERLAFMNGRCGVRSIAESANAFGAELILVDYIQRIGTHGKPGDPRGAVDAAMSDLRVFADGGRSVIVVAALARSKDTKGRSSYREGISLASFRESSELEYGADDAYILTPNRETDDEREPTPHVRLQHLKSRYGETKDIEMIFEKKHQRFTTIEPSEPSSESRDSELIERSG